MSKSDCDITWNEHLWGLFKKLGATIDGDYSNMTLTNVKVTFLNTVYDSMDEIREHCYFMPSSQRAFGYFMLTPQFKDLMDRLTQLLTNQSELKEVSLCRAAKISALKL